MITHEKALHEGITQDDSSPGRCEVRFGPTQAPRIRGLTQRFTTMAPVPYHTGELGPVRDLEIRMKRAFDRETANPDRA